MILQDPGRIPGRNIQEVKRWAAFLTTIRIKVLS